MEIRIVSVGKIKEKYLSAGIAEYAKRLSRYCKLTFCQVPDEKTPDKASETVNQQIKDTEGERLLKHIREQDYVVIGGSLGLSDKVLKRADYKLSFSKMTFPHQLMQMILLEQIYRSYRIINHEPYHK